ncbi:MAG: MBL fold metallo-hydrolase [Balneolaceae bacterium]|nr:MBL fold metallo-hydrolase [Balneolaceae bacterium]
MSLSKTTLGPFELYTIETGDIKLDGGAMFGVVPKTLWSRGIPADEKNRIPMTMRCLLIKSNNTGKIYLVDNGAGTKFNEKMENIYQLDYSDKNIHKSLKTHGFSEEDISDIIFTHLHFDHCGGTTYYDEQGHIQFTFPNATYHVTKTHWKSATDPNAREKASFINDNIEPLSGSEVLHFVDGEHEYEPGLSTILANGHTIGQQLPKIEADGKTLIFVADLLPTHVHVPLPWVMGYDMYPVQTLTEKDAFLKQAAEKDWKLYLEHDVKHEVITITYDGRKFKVKDFLKLSDL